MASNVFDRSAAQNWLEWRRHLVMAASASNDPGYVTDVMFHPEGRYVNCPMDEDLKKLIEKRFLTKDRFAQSAQCRGHWFSYFEYQQEIAAGPFDLQGHGELSKNVKRAKRIFHVFKSALTLTSGRQLPKLTHALETVNHVDSYRYPSEVFFLYFDQKHGASIDNPKIVLQVTMPLSEEVDPTRAYLGKFQAQYDPKVFDRTKAIAGQDFFVLSLKDLDPKSLARALCGDAGTAEGNGSGVDHFSKYPLGVVFQLESPGTTSPGVIADLTALASRKGAANVFFVASNDNWTNKGSAVMRRLRSFKYNMMYRHESIEWLAPSRAPRDPTVKQILASAGFGAEKIQAKRMKPGLSRATVWLVQYYRNALRTSWKVLKVGEWDKLQDEYCRYQMFVEDRLPTIRARFVAGPKNVLSRGTANRDSKHNWRAGIEYSLASTLANDRPEALADWMLRATYRDVGRLADAIDKIFGRILVSWDDLRPKSDAKITEELRQTFRNSHKGDYLKPDRRPFMDVTKEYGAHLLGGKILKDAEEEGKSVQKKLLQAIDQKVKATLRTIPQELKYVRSVKVCHGDLHAENIIIDGQEALWVIDFGQTGLHHSLCDFVTLEYSIRWRHCIPKEKGVKPKEREAFENDLLELRYWRQPWTLVERYYTSNLGKYAAILSTVRKHAQGFAATGLPGFGFPEYLTCLGLKCLTAIRNEPPQYEGWCNMAHLFFTHAKDILRTGLRRAPKS